MMDGSEGAWEDALEALDFPVDPLTGMRVWSEEALHAMGGVALGKIESSGDGTGEEAETRRLACVLAGIVKIVRRREGDGIVVLSDPSGRMRAAVHRDVLEMEKGIDVGTALVLSDVTLFRGADAHDDAAGSTMIVTTRNVTSVFHSFDCRGTSAHNERGSRRPLLPHEKKLKSNANAAPLLPLPAPQQCTASFKGRVEGVAHPDEKARGSRSAAGGGDGAARSNAHGDPATISGRYQGELGPVDVAPEPLTARYGNRADDQSRLIASAGGGKDTAGHLKRTRPDPTRDQENNRPLDLEQRHNFDPGDAIKQMKTGTAAAGAAAAPRSRVGEDDDELTAMLRMMESDCDGDFGV